MPLWIYVALLRVLRCKVAHVRVYTILALSSPEHKSSTNAEDRKALLTSFLDRMEALNKLCSSSCHGMPDAPSSAIASHPSTHGEPKVHLVEGASQLHCLSGAHGHLPRCMPAEHTQPVNSSAAGQRTFLPCRSRLNAPTTTFTTDGQTKAQRGERHMRYLCSSTHSMGP